MYSAPWYVLQQLAYSSPALLAYLAGLILGLVFIRKYPTPAMFTLVGSLVMLLTTIGLVLSQVYLIRFRMASGWSPAGYSQVLALVSIVGNLLRALGLALWLAAVFIGRKPPATS